MVRKMYIVPSDYFDSLARKANITDNPLLTAEVLVEKEKDKIIKKRKKQVSDQDVTDFVKSSQNKLILDEMRKTTTDHPQFQEQIATISPTPLLQPKIKVEPIDKDQSLNVNNTMHTDQLFNKEDPFTSALDYYESTKSFGHDTGKNGPPVTSTPITKTSTIKKRTTKLSVNPFLHDFYKYDPSKRQQMSKIPKLTVKRSRVEDGKVADLDDFYKHGAVKRSRFDDENDDDSDEF